MRNKVLVPAHVASPWAADVLIGVCKNGNRRAVTPPGGRAPALNRHAVRRPINSLAPDARLSCGTRARILPHGSHEGLHSRGSDRPRKTALSAATRLDFSPRPSDDRRMAPEKYPSIRIKKIKNKKSSRIFYPYMRKLGHVCREGKYNAFELQGVRPELQGVRPRTPGGPNSRGSELQGVRPEWHEVKRKPNKENEFGWKDGTL